MARDGCAKTSLALSASLFLSPAKPTNSTISRHNLCDSRMVRDYLIVHAPDEKPLAEITSCFTVAAITARSRPSCGRECEFDLAFHGRKPAAPSHARASALVGT
jgi:hypothetical protein